MTTATTDAIAEQVFLPRPIKPYPSNSRGGLMGTEPVPDGEVDWYGHCAPWCITDTPVSGADIEEHGDWCESLSHASVDGRDAAGEPVEIVGRLVQWYRHGTYRLSDLQRRRELWDRPSINLTLLGVPVSDPAQEGHQSYISVGEARRLAAALLHLADLGDGLTGRRPEMLETERRRRSGRTDSD